MHKNARSVLKLRLIVGNLSSTFSTNDLQSSVRAFLLKICPLFFLLQNHASQNVASFKELNLFIRHGQGSFLIHWQLSTFLSLVLLYENDGSIFRENKFEGLAKHTSCIQAVYKLTIK